MQAFVLFEESAAGDVEDVDGGSES